MIDLLEQGGINTLFLSLSFSVKKIELGIFLFHTKSGNKKREWIWKLSKKDEDQ